MTTQIELIQNQKQLTSNKYEDFGNGHTANRQTRQQILTTLEDLQTEIEQANGAETGSLREKIRKVTELFNQFSFPEEANPEQVEAIAAKIRKTSNLDTLLNTAVTEVLTALQADRVLVYQFTTPVTGMVAAEAIRDGFTPTFEEKLPAISFGLGSAMLYEQEKVVLLTDVYNSSLSPHPKQLMERFQVRACVSLPILTNDEVWGLLVVQQCTSSRQWQNSEIQLLKLIKQEVEVQLQVAAVRAQLQLEAQGDQVSANLAKKIFQAEDLELIFRMTTQEARQVLRCDRVAIYRFNPDWTGEFIADSAGAEWVSLLEEQRKNPAIVNNVNSCSVKDLAGNRGLVGATSRSPSADTYLQQTQGKSFTRGQVYRVSNDIYNSGFSDCYIKVLESYEAKAYIIVAIYQGEQLWGLFAAYQNSGSRQWQDSEIRLTLQLATMFGIAVQQSQYLQELHNRNAELKRIAEAERALTRMVEKIRQFPDLETIFRNTLPDLRQLLKCDRLTVYRFNPDWSGEFIAESVGGDWVPVVGPNIKTVWEDDHLQETQGGRYRNSESFAVDDIYTVGHKQCHIDILEQFQIRAYMIAPIFLGKKLWGLLSAYQNSGPRQWQENEIRLLTKIGIEFGIAARQAHYLQQTQANSEQLAKLAEREAANAKFSYRLPSRLSELAQKNSDALELIQFAVNELRQLLKADRVGMFRFNPDWSGEFVVESLVGDWPKLIGTNLAMVKDIYLQNNHGGRYARKESLRVDNIYTFGHQEYDINLLEGWGTKAYMIAPIFKGDKLWGLLGVYQNSTPRQWEQSEEDVLNQAGVQIGKLIGL